ncbi:MAG: zinc ribbon domain-containing protein [Spirochaetaceae bacterium]|nr:zinc ribbon domain-containing protein [Spirochaetaceae bacterium]
MNDICPWCGRVIDGEFIFCPWCGANTRQAWKDDSGERLYRDERQKRLSHIEKSLDALDRELAVLALSEAMHR